MGTQKLEISEKVGLNLHAIMQCKKRPRVTCLLTDVFNFIESQILQRVSIIIEKLKTS